MTEMIDLNNLLLSPVLQIGVVGRYSGLYTQRKESVADHITQVGLISFIIANKLIDFGESIDLGKVTLYALIHDVDEALTCDVPRNVKYFNNVIRNELDKVAVEALATLSNQLEITNLTELWRQSKKDGIEGLIVEIADMIQVVKKTMEEVELLGNLYMLKVALEVDDYLSKVHTYLQSDIHIIQNKSREFLGDLITQAIQIIGDIKIRHEYEIDKLKIKNLKFSGSEGFLE